MCTDVSDLEVRLCLDDLDMRQLCRDSASAAAAATAAAAAAAAAAAV